MLILDTLTYISSEKMNNISAVEFRLMLTRGSSIGYKTIILIDHNTSTDILLRVLQARSNISNFRSLLLSRYIDILIIDIFSHNCVRLNKLNDKLGTGILEPSIYIHISAIKNHHQHMNWYIVENYNQKEESIYRLLVNWLFHEIFVLAGMFVDEWKDRFWTLTVIVGKSSIKDEVKLWINKAVLGPLICLSKVSYVINSNEKVNRLRTVKLWVNI